MFGFEELNDKTRSYMLSEFEKEEQSGDPYRSKRLSLECLIEFPDLMRKAITTGDECSLTAGLLFNSYWLEHIPGQVGMLAITEFNTWYVRGLTKLLMDEGILDCQVYNACPELSCAHYYEDHVFTVTDVYTGHRRCYHGPNRSHIALSIPEHPNCGYSVRRVPVAYVP